MEFTSAGNGEQRLALRFVGSGSEYFRIWIVNLLLTLVTLGLYYPFAKVRRLKYFHGATEIGGYPMSFHADPRRMLRGYLLVALMLAAYWGAGHFSPVAGLAAFAIIALLWPALWHSSLRFRLHNTGWRGLRFRFTGTRGGAYLALGPAFFLAFVVALAGWWLQAGAATTPDPARLAPGATTVAAAIPLLMLLLAPALLWLMRRYQHQNYALASEQTRFSVRARSFYALLLRAAGLGLLVAIAGGLVLAAVLWALGPNEAGGQAVTLPKGPADQGNGLHWLVLAPLLLAAAINLAVLPYVTARMQNLVWNGTHSTQLRFSSRLRFKALLGLTLKNWLFIVLSLGLYLPFAAIATARLRLQAVEVMMAIDPEQLVASARQADEAAAGDAAGDLLGLDIGL